jgi:hypothetical protein
VHHFYDESNNHVHVLQEVTNFSIGKDSVVGVLVCKHTPNFSHQHTIGQSGVVCLSGMMIGCLGLL